MATKHNKRKREAKASAKEQSAEPSATTIVSAPERSSTVTQPVAQSAIASNNLLALAASCTVRDSAAIKNSLLGLYATDAPVTLDVRAVERIDAAVLQLLCAFVRDRRAGNRSTHWVGSPDSFTEAVRVLGVAETLGIQATELGAAA